MGHGKDGSNIANGMTADLTGPGWTLEEVKAIENAKKAD